MKTLENLAEKAFFAALLAFILWRPATAALQAAADWHWRHYHPPVVTPDYLGRKLPVGPGYNGLLGQPGGKLPRGTPGQSAGDRQSGSLAAKVLEDAARK